MMLRFRRKYNLIITYGSEQLEINTLKIEFSCTKSNKSELNKLTLKVYNLNPKHIDNFNKSEKNNKYIQVKLYVGYADRAEMIFKGSVLSCSTIRDGTNLVSNFDCIDGHDAGTFVAVSSKTRGTAVNSVIDQMPNTAKGVIVPYDENLRPIVAVGKAGDVLTKLNKNKQFYINDEQVFIIKPNQAISNFIADVNATTGLISTPTLEDKILKVECLINPLIKLSSRFNLISKFNPQINGIYRADAIDYSGDSHGQAWNMVISSSKANDYEVVT